MSSLIERITRQAGAAFSQGLADPTDTQSFQELVKLVDDLRATDVNLNDSLARASPHMRRTSTCYYIDVFTSETFAISISVLNPGMSFPLHDTTGMCGIVKVISGCASITTYTEVADDNANIAVPQDVRAQVRRSERDNAVFIPVNKTELARVAVPHAPSTLKPEQDNFHEICAIGYTAAFIKVLAPPYDMVNRVYTFYRALQTAEEDAAVKTWLVRSRPDMFFSSTLPYCGPQIAL